MKNRTIALAGLLLCAACTTKTTGEEGIFTGSYIREFCYVEDLSVWETGYFTVDETNRIIAPYGRKNMDQTDRSQIVLELNMAGERISEHSERYMPLCREIGDTLFNRKISIYTFMHRPDALTEMIENIHITVNESYSSACPAGADASGLFTLFYENPYAVIHNDYQTPPDAYCLSSEALPRAFYKTSLAGADLKGKKALGVQYYLLLNSAPDQSGSYSFTIGVEAADGDKLKITTKPISIQAEP